MRKFTVEFYDKGEDTSGVKVRWVNEAGKRSSPDNDTPAIEWYSGTKLWCEDGQLHRLDGPARICIDGTEEYWLDGKIYSKEDHAEKVAELQRESQRKDMTISQIEEILGYPIKVVEEKGA